MQEGQPGFNGGPNGDLYVFLKVKEHPFFERHENDLHCVIPINFAQAALGAEIEVPTLGQPHKLRIPEGTQSNAEFRIRAQGVASVNGHGRGDLVVHVEVRTPSKLLVSRRSCSSNWRPRLPVENEPKEKGLFDKVRDYFS